MISRKVKISNLQEIAVIMVWTKFVLNQLIVVCDIGKLQKLKLPRKSSVTIATAAKCMTLSTALRRVMTIIVLFLSH